MRTPIASLVLVLVCLSAAADAQVRRPEATLTPAVQRVTATTARLALHVKLPAAIHVQSNEPRDPALIATTLTLDAPKGVTVEKIAYPPASELQQAGVKEPLAVFGSEFVITVDLELASELPSGQLTLPGRLRYQACDDKVCYRPIRAQTAWVVTLP